MFSRKNDELEKPPISQEKDSFEILRVWAGSNRQQYSLKTNWDDPGAWGLLLVDIARHTAKAYGGSGNMTEQEALNRIKKLFDAEWGSPTDVPEQVE
jgi:hypothetical protein